eukprot:gnl/TRDRNA2_/TRDRNA2_67421_c0_seq1.p1 gnl/TRDRNA2_/TRDRNA2_67421_c0~~gnl/TRDRNA2_/TRDRNA2_67421_c0_seq1.p1  ORF type:complete len:244 (-),score=43.89 gnl/TRDRNA2_/TRDRNA2_67421_c0_seq1:225-956(-)
MPPGVRIGPVKGSTLVRDAQRQNKAKADDKRIGEGLREKYGAFVKDIDMYKKGAFVKVREDDCEVLKREVAAFSSIDSCNELEGGSIAVYASEWEDKMEEMVGKGFCVVHACSDTGQLIMKALPGANGCDTRRESTWSSRFAVLDGNGDYWCMPCTAFQLTRVKPQCNHGHELKKVELEFYEGYVHTRTCDACSKDIPREEARYHCAEDGHDGGFDVCLECFANGTNAKDTIDGLAMTRVFCC